MEKKTIITRAEVVPGKEEEFLSLVEGMMKVTRSEKGNLSYTIYQNPFNRSSFIFYEEYMHHTAIWQHSNSDEYKEFLAAINNLLKAELEVASL